MSEQNAYERQDSDPQTVHRKLTLNAWSVQNIVWDLVKSFMLRNNPADEGYIIDQRFTDNPTTTGIVLDIAYNWNAEKVQKRPAIFIQRSQNETTNPVMGGAIGRNVAESVKQTVHMSQMTVLVKCIATELPVVEQLASWIRGGLLPFQQQIQRDFCFQRFRIAGLTAPTPVKESKENFEVSIVIEIAYVEGFVVQGDDLKLKHVLREVDG